MLERWLGLNTSFCANFSPNVPVGGPRTAGETGHMCASCPSTATVIVCVESEILTTTSANAGAENKSATRAPRKAKRRIGVLLKNLVTSPRHHREASVAEWPRIANSSAHTGSLSRDVSGILARGESQTHIDRGSGLRLLLPTFLNVHGPPLTGGATRKKHDCPS